MTKISFHRVFPIVGIALAGMLFAFGAAIAPTEADAAGSACTSKKFNFKQVEAACKEGGRKAAKKLMKKVVKQSKKAGDKKTCLDCHKDLKSFANTKNAVADMKKYLK